MLLLAAFKVKGGNACSDADLEALLGPGCCGLVVVTDCFLSKVRKIRWILPCSCSRFFLVNSIFMQASNCIVLKLTNAHLCRSVALYMTAGLMESQMFVLDTPKNLQSIFWKCWVFEEKLAGLCSSGVSNV
ncbi:hypothetical protein Droror1_Dr00010865 [Drosera rotundifolia]